MEQNVKKKRRCPWFWRRQTSCPDCGFIEKADGDFEAIIHTKGLWVCPRCECRYDAQEFWELNSDKYSTQCSEETNE